MAPSSTFKKLRYIANRLAWKGPKFDKHFLYITAAGAMIFRLWRDLCIVFVFDVVHSPYVFSFKHKQLNIETLLLMVNISLLELKTGKDI